MNEQKELTYEPWFGEFPDLIFCSRGNNVSYFDATHYILRRSDASAHSVGAFRELFSGWIDAAGTIYALEREEMFSTDPIDGHELVEASLALLFVAYVDPAFGIYMTECVTQLLLEGFMCSDTYVMHQACKRFTSEELITKMN